MPDPILSELNSTTVFELYNEVVADNYFRNAPFLAYLRDHCRVPFDGGSYMQFAHVYAPLLGGFYSRGDTFNTVKPQTISGAQFDPRTVEVNITEYLEDLRINNRGPNARISLLDADFQTAANTMNAIVAIALNRHGQAISGDNRIKAPNGLSEIVNNGLDPSWDGNVFTTYGGQARNGAIGAAFNGNVYWNGDASGNAQMITYNTLLNQYLRCLRTKEGGGGQPDLIYSNLAAYGYMLERMQVQQRFAQEKDPIWGFESFRLQNAFVLPDNYAPSATSAFGVNDASIGNYSTSAFTTPASGLTTQGNFPSATSVTPAEVIFILNTKTFLFRIVNDELFGGGFKPFIYSADTTRVSGQMLLGFNIENLSPWNNNQILGVNA